MTIIRRMCLSFLCRTALCWPDSLYLKLMYWLRLRKKLNLKNPRRFTEKLQWLKLNYRDPVMTRMVDKYEVKKWIAEKIGSQYVIPLLGVYNSFEEIDFDALPERFMLKTTHDSGGGVFCDKRTLNKKAVRKIINSSLHRDYWKYGREWGYKDVPRRIIAEQYEESLGKPDSIEYKLTCINGECRMITICTGIPHSTNDVRKNDHFDKNWNRLPFYVDYENTNKEFEKSPIIEEMIALSEKLTKGIPQVRVDFYLIRDQIYFGEFTFYTHAGFMSYQPDEWDYIMGGWFELPPKLE